MFKTLVLLAGFLAGISVARAQVSPAEALAAANPAQAIYRDGVLPSGQPLHGERAAGIAVQGGEAACATCHRRSGYGASEGQIRIPPIAGSALYQSRGKYALNTQAGPGYTPGRAAYTDETLARAIRDGIAPTGRPLSYLMPRYALDDASMASLIRYLKQLSAETSPGVTGDTVHFATIITPDADPAARRGMLDVMAHFFEDKNEFLKGGTKPIMRNAEIYYRVQRKWQLHIWELSGPPETWRPQLVRKLQEEPVFAVLSGVGGRTWAPVQDFCREAALPCLFPNVDLPVTVQNDFYSVYFSKGVVLESELVANRLSQNRERWGVRRLVQIFRAGDIGEDAARALAANLASVSVPVNNDVLSLEAGKEDVAEAMARVNSGDAVMLWLRPSDVSVLTATQPAPPQAAAVFMSGVMGGLEDAPLPAAWRNVTRMAYPLDLPDRRSVRMTQPLTWFKVHDIPVVAPRVQADTYLACGIVSEALSEMLDRFVREIVLERLEVMLNSRLFTGNYTRLGLAQGQRFASKGGYIVRFAQSAGTRLQTDEGYVVPP